jgi:hypothetical protein
MSVLKNESKFEYEKEKRKSKDFTIGVQTDPLQY